MPLGFPFLLWLGLWQFTVQERRSRRLQSRDLRINRPDAVLVIADGGGAS
jgi:hypothetical protein